MENKSITLLALCLFATLALAGCGLFHHPGHRCCSAPCEMAAGQHPCMQQENSVKSGCNKPCCVKMQATETPAQ